MIISAWDLSLTCCGWARSKDGILSNCETFEPKTKDMQRLIEIRNSVICSISDLFIFEDLALHSRDGKATERAGLSYIIRLSLFEQRRPYIMITPGSNKKFCTGSGSGKKDLMLKEVYKRWSLDLTSDDAADAASLCYLGMALVGEWTPTTDAQRAVVAQVRKANASVLERLK